MAIITKTKVKAIQFEITLNEAEAEFLKSIAQNPYTDPDSERPCISKFREQLFNFLKKELEGIK